MKINTVLDTASSALGVKRWVILMLTCSQLVSVLALIALLSQKNTHRETLIPPSIHQTFWVESDRVSKEYLIEMGVFIAQVYLDVTPANVDFNHKMLKKYLSPAAYGKFEVNAGVYAKRIKDDNASTQFAITGMRVDETQNRIALMGVLNSYLGDNRTSSVQKIYIFEFAFIGGRVLLSGMKESTNAQNPFGSIVEQ